MMDRTKGCIMSKRILFYALSILLVLSGCSVQKKKNGQINVSASKDKIMISLKNLGEEGKAQLYAYKANEYFTKDPLKGISKKVKAKGTLVGKYDCHTNQTLKRERYEKGVDHLYDKYYLIQNGKILDGPVYASTIQSAKKSISFKQTSIKGIYNEESSDMNVIDDVKANSMTTNIDLCKLLFANEDAKGRPLKIKDKSLPMTVNGKIYYFNPAYVKKLDRRIIAASKRSMNVIGIIIAWKRTASYYPAALKYDSPKSQATLGFNTSNDTGRDYFIAMMEFLTKRYSQSQATGLISNYVISNEIDSTHYFYNCADLNVFMEEYSRALRLANLAVKKYAADIHVVVPFTHYWKGYAKEIGQENPGTESLRPYDELEWLVKETNARGAYDWGIAPHTYAVYNTASNYLYVDTKSGYLTDSYKTTKEITFSNFGVWRQYLSLPQVRYKGKLRNVYLTESGLSSFKNSQLDQKRQAADFAMAYYKVSHFSFVKTYNFYRRVDHKLETKAGLSCGLFDEKGKKKLVYNVYKYIDTNKTFEYSDPYLKYLPYYKTFHKVIPKSWQEAVSIYDTGFNWQKEWSTSQIIKRQI